MKAKDRCIIFLEQNGWKCDIDVPSDEYISYSKGGYMGVDFVHDKMIFIDGNGDRAHFYINYYTLIGFLMEYRQIDYMYISVK